MDKIAIIGDIGITSYCRAPSVDYPLFQLKFIFFFAVNLFILRYSLQDGTLQDAVILKYDVSQTALIFSTQNSMGVHETFAKNDLVFF